MLRLSFLNILNILKNLKKDFFSNRSLITYFLLNFKYSLQRCGTLLTFWYKRVKAKAIMTITETTLKVNILYNLDEILLMDMKQIDSGEKKHLMLKKRISKLLFEKINDKKLLLIYSTATNSSIIS